MLTDFCFRKLLFLFLFFFASPKKNQKKSPTKDYIAFVGGSYVRRLYYCSFSICNSIVGKMQLVVLAIAFFRLASPLCRFVRWLLGYKRLFKLYAIERLDEPLNKKPTQDAWVLLYKFFTFKLLRHLPPKQLFCYSTLPQNHF